MRLQTPGTRTLLGGAGALALLTGFTGHWGAPSGSVTPAPLVHSQAVSAPVVAAAVEPVLTKRVHSASRSRVVKAPGAVPVGDLPGWRQVVREDFVGSRVPAGWGVYSGSPGGNANGWWERDHVAVRGNDLHLVGDWQGGRFVTGGLMADLFTSTYGKYEVRFKVNRAHGVKYALLLWPAHGGWPSAGEIDFAEDGGGSRRSTTATLHYGASNSQVQRHLKADFSRFQTVGVEWTPGKLVYTLNGKPWATVVSPHVPDGPMRLALQLEAGNGSRWSPAPRKGVTPSTVDLVVDWVVAYRRA